MKLNEIPGKYSCDYGHIFEAPQVKLVPFKNKFKATLGRVLHVDALDNSVLSGGIREEGNLLACPVCSTIHCSGFESVNLDKPLTTVPVNLDRKLATDL
jgi:hypothetical protein